LGPLVTGGKRGRGDRARNGEAAKRAAGEGGGGEGGTLRMVRTGAGNDDGLCCCV